MQSTVFYIVVMYNEQTKLSHDMQCLHTMQYTVKYNTIQFSSSALSCAFLRSCSTFFSFTSSYCHRKHNTALIMAPVALYAYYYYMMDLISWVLGSTPISCISQWWIRKWPWLQLVVAECCQASPVIKIMTAFIWRVWPKLSEQWHCTCCYCTY